MQQPDFFCREVSLAAHEPLFGTAAHTELWLVLEVQTPWGPKGLEDSALDGAVVERLSAFTRRFPLARVQLIRTPEREHVERPKLFLARCSDATFDTYELTLASHADVLEVDLEAWAQGALPTAASRVTEPLFLVCVHGKRDRCCAQQGMPLYTALSELAPGRVYQTTHLGGHRFAATMVVLPHGSCYGRVDASRARDIVEAHARGELFDLASLRGRTAFAPAVQAADYLLRTRLGERGIAALSLDREEAIEGGTRVWFRSTRDGQRHHVDVASRALGSLPASCGAEPKPTSCFVALERLTSSR